MRPHYTPVSLRNVIEIWQYTFEQWDDVQADEYVATLLTTCQDLASGLRKGRRVMGLAPGYLAYPVESHVIVFRLVRNRSEYSIEVARFLHMRSDFANIRLR